MPPHLLLQDARFVFGSLLFFTAKEGVFCTASILDLIHGLVKQKGVSGDREGR